MFEKQIYRYNFPTTIYFGPGAIDTLGDLLRENKISRPLLVTDRDLAKLPIFENVVSNLGNKGFIAATFSGVFGNPVKSQVDAGLEKFKEFGADSIVALGGGASMDVAKAIALMAHHPGDLFEYEDGLPNSRPVDQHIPFLIAIPTTSGTGSEVGRSTVISLDDSKAKKIMFSPRLMPSIVIADPELTYDLPAKVTAATGMDALTHLVEAYLSKGFQPVCDGIALEGVRLVSQSLAKAVEFAGKRGDRSDAHLQARGLMLNASMMGGMAFQKGLGLVHSLAHPLSTVCDLHHGLANGIMIPYGMEFNVPAAKERMTTLAEVAGAKQKSPEGFVDWLKELKTQIGIPVGLKDVGVKQEHLEGLVHYATIDVCHPSGPRTVTSDDFKMLYQKALAV